MAFQIFQAEKEDALAEILTQNQTVAFTSEVLPLVKTDSEFNAIAKTFEGNSETPDTDDLFYTKSVFVSSVWNLNTDVFLPGEVWKARKTPVDKPTNNSHNEMKIVGHITSVWAVDGEGNIIEDDTDEDDLPDLIHLCNSAVIYRHWRDRDLRAASDNLIADIVAGERFVSMECFFDNFDYAMKNEAGAFQVVPRNEQTAFLTKHLQSYGGAGEFNGYALGRVLRNFTFSGKGYVDRPANPDSKIFDFKNKNCFSFASTDKFGVYIICNSNNTEKDTMSDENKVEKAIAEITAKLEAAIAESTKATAKVTELEDQLKVATATVDALKTSEAQLTEKFDAIKLERDAMATKLAEINQEKSLASRTQALLDKGFTPELAKAKVEDFKDLTDEQFTKVIALVVKQPEVGGNTVEISKETVASVNVPNVKVVKTEAQFAALAGFLDETFKNPVKKESK